MCNEHAFYRILSNLSDLERSVSPKIISGAILMMQVGYLLLRQTLVIGTHVVPRKPKQL